MSDLLPMYKGKSNSPSTTLVKNISATTNIIEIADTSVLPFAPNLATIGRGDEAEVILYNEIDGNVLKGVQRGQSGTEPKIWLANEEIYNGFTSKHINDMISNINSLNDGKLEKTAQAADSLLFDGKSSSEFATSEQGEKAETALQSVPDATTKVKGVSFLGASGGAATYDDFQNLLNSGFENEIINPLTSGMSFSQRGISFTSTGSKIYTLDRKFLTAPNGHLTVIQDSDGSAKISINGTTTGGSWGEIIENFKDYQGKKAVFSFTIRNTTTILGRIYASGSVANEITIPPNANDTRLTISTDILPINLSSLMFTFDVPNGTTGGNSYNIKLMHVWKTTMSSPKEIPFLVGRDISQTILACQRYYEKSYSIDAFPGTDILISSGVATNEIFINSPVIYKVTKRIIPNVTVYAYDGTPKRVSAFANASHIETNDINLIKANEQGFLGLQIISGINNFVTGNYYWFNWTSDAEL